MSGKVVTKVNTPMILMGKEVALDAATRKELKQYMVGYCGQYGHVVLSEALNMAPVNDGRPIVSAQLVGRDLEVSIRCASRKADQLARLAWSFRAALVRRGAIAMEQTDDGTLIKVRVRLSGQTLSQLVGRKAGWAAADTAVAVA